MSVPLRNDYGKILHTGSENWIWHLELSTVSPVKPDLTVICLLCIKIKALIGKVLSITVFLLLLYPKVKSKNTQK